MVDRGETVVRRATGNDAAAVGRLFALEAHLHEQWGGYAVKADFDWVLGQGMVESPWAPLLPRRARRRHRRLCLCADAVLAQERGTPNRLR